MTGDTGKMVNLADLRAIVIGLTLGLVIVAVLFFGIDILLGI